MKCRRVRRKLHNEELQNTYSSPDIIRMIKLWKMRWTRHIVCMAETRNAFKILVGRDHLEEQGVDGC
jgi:hypothetical protein